MPDTAPQTRILVACAVAGLGLMLLATLDPYPMSVLRLGQTGVGTPYPAVAAAVVGLLAWHLAPRRAWAWSLLAGALCTVVSAAVTLDPELMTEANHLLLLGIMSCAPVFTLIGLLGAATLVWRSDSRAVGAALAGATVGLWLVGPMVTFIAGIAWPDPLDDGLRSVLTVVLTAAGLLAGVVGVFLRRVPEHARPEWRVTLAGAVAAAAPMIGHLWDPLSTTGRPSDYFLHLSLVLAALGLVAGAAVVGAAEGFATLLSAVAAGLLLSTFGVLLVLAIGVLASMALVVILVLGGVVAGYLLALSRLRTAFGAGALIVVAAGLTALYLLVNSSGNTEATLDVLAPVLLAVAAIATVTAGASIGDTLADSAAAPAVFAGLAIPFSLALYAYTTYEWEAQRPTGAQSAELLLLAAGALVVSALALLGLHRTRRAPADEPEPEAPQPTPAEHQLQRDASGG